MKKIQLLFSIIFLFAISTSLSFGQASNKNKQVVTSEYNSSGYIVCTGEYVVGNGEFIYSYWDKKVQTRIDVTYVGDWGNIYEWHAVENVMFKDIVPGQTYNYTSVMNGIVYMNGEAMAIYKVLVHYTINPDGKMTADVNKSTIGWECL